MATDLEKVERSVSKSWYKLTLGALKVIPMLLAFCALLNTCLSFYGFRCDILSLFGGVSFIPLAFFYLVSYVFQFCAYHRMFLHHILITDILNLIDYYIWIPVSDRAMFGVYLLISGIFAYLALYYYRKEKCCKR